MADHVNRGFESGDSTGRPTGWARSTAPAREFAGYKRSGNLLLDSERFEAAGAWNVQNVVITNDDDTGPFEDPDDPADLMAEATDVAQLHQVWQNITLTATGRATLSCYAKKVSGGRDWLRLMLDTLSDGVNFNLTDGSTTGLIGSISAANPLIEFEAVGDDGWYRCAMTIDATAGSANVYVGSSDSATSAGSYDGDGRDNFHIYGAQVHEGAEAVLGYVRTSTVAVRDEQGFEDYEVLWDGNEDYKNDLADTGSTVAEYVVAAVDDVEFEAYEEEWDGNEGYLTALGAAVAADYFLGENLLPYSEDFDNAVWVKTECTISANSGGIPNTVFGVEDPQSDRIVDNANNDVHGVSYNATTTTDNPVFSIFTKAVNLNWLYVSIDDLVDDSVEAWFDLANGVIGSANTTGGAGAALSIEDAGGGFYRCTVSCTGVTAGTVSAGIGGATADTVSSYVGSAQPTISIIGAMLFESTSPSEYIKTTTAVGALTSPFDGYEVQWDANSAYANSWLDVPAPVLALYDIHGDVENEVEDYEEEWGTKTSHTVDPDTGNSRFEYEGGAIGPLLTADEPVQFENQGGQTLPSGFAFLTTYYVSAPLTNVYFNLAATPSGADIPVTDVGTGAPFTMRRLGGNFAYWTAFPAGSLQAANYDTAPEAFEDYEEEWSLMTTI
jgi:hypothetical protein